MQAPVKHIIQQQTFWLSALRCLFWEEQKVLIVSDVHFGKTGHFRKSGIAVPQSVFKEDIQRLVHSLHFFKLEKLIVVGDFFHSRANLELNLFTRWRNDFAYLPIILVKGNHDILHESWYKEAHIEVVNDLTINDFYFTHEYTQPNGAIYTFSGHIHPGIIIKGLGKQALKFPCFYFTPHYAVLPAFSRFTGLALMDPKRAEQVYAIAENDIIRIQ